MICPKNTMLFVECIRYASVGRKPGNCETALHFLRKRNETAPSLTKSMPLKACKFFLVSGGLHAPKTRPIMGALYLGTIYGSG